MIIVTGATGKLGKAIVQLLVKRIGAAQVGVSTRDPRKADNLAAVGVRVRRGDFDDAESLLHAFEGATQVLIISSNARATGGDPLAQHRSAIDAARAASARRIVYTSHAAASKASLFPPMVDHAATETMLRESGVAWTALRHGFYAASGLMLMGDALKTGVTQSPADGLVSWTAHADLAQAAAIILSDEGRFEGPTPALTGAEAFDLAGLAKIASDVLGRAIRRETISDDAFKTKMASRGVPPVAVAMALDLFAASRAGEFAAVDPTLERLLGRRPTSMRQFIASAAH